MIRAQHKRQLKRAWRKRAPWIKRNLIAFAVAILHMQLFAGPLGRRAEPILLDVMGAVSAPHAALEDVVVVAIDESSYAKLGLSSLEPWPRAKHVELLTKLAAAGTKLVVFDMFFREKTDEGADNRLAAALKLLPTFIGTYEIPSRTGPTVANDYRSYPPQALFTESARRVVLLQGALDYGVIRRFTAGRRTESTAPPLLDALAEEGFLNPPLPSSSDFIRFYGPPRTFTAWSYADVLEKDNEAFRAMFAGKIVLVGILTGADPGIVRKDSFPTAVFGEPMFGVEIHATTIVNALRKDWIHRFPPFVEHLFLDVMAFILTLGILLRSPPQGALLLFGSGALWACGSYLAFRAGWFVPGLLLVCVILPVIFTLSTFYYYLVFRRSYKDMESALGVHLHMNDR